MTRPEAGAALRGLVAGLNEPTEDARVRRLLERVAAREDAELLRAALAEEGALAVLRSAAV